jgi:hypothetical protein
MKESNLMREVRNEARQEYILDALRTRFQAELPKPLADRVRSQQDANVLSRWHQLAITAPTLEAFQAGLD